MPELPEVETVRHGLEKFLVGEKITRAVIFNEKSFLLDNTENSQGKSAKPEIFPENNAAKITQILENKEVVKIRRRGKMLILDLSENWSIAAHLKMTGQMVVRSSGENWGAGHPNESFVADLPDRTTRVALDFASGTRLFFNDQRKFGWLKLMPTNNIAQIPLLEKMGPEPLVDQENFASTYAIFLKNIRRHQKTSIKSAILNQEIVAGVGNIYADESLWSSKIHPATKVAKISDTALKNLLKNIAKVMRESLAAGGSTMKNYVNADGSRGDYLEKFAKVFRRENSPCPRCGATIQKIRVAGRGTHFCPKCQIERK